MQPHDFKRILNGMIFIRVAEVQSMTFGLLIIEKLQLKRFLEYN
jgi:hypothetical protein